MIDVLKKKVDKIDVQKLSDELGVSIVETSALKEKGIKEAALKAVETAGKAKKENKVKFFSEVEKAIIEVEKKLPENIPSNLYRWYAIKLIERDKVVLENIDLSDAEKKSIEEIVSGLEKKI